MFNIRTLALSAAIIAAPVVAIAAPVTGGNTVLRVTADLTPDTLPGTTITPGVTGGATVVSTSPLDLNLPITGGELDVDLGGTIEHVGSGVTFSLGADTLALFDLVVDTELSVVRGDVSLNGASIASDIDLFVADIADLTIAEITGLANPLIELRISTAVSNLLIAAGLTTAILDGTRIGFGATDPTVTGVAEPAMLALFGLGLAGLAAARRRRAV